MGSNRGLGAAAEVMPLAPDWIYHKSWHCNILRSRGVYP